MKIFAITLGLLALVAAAVGFNVWRALAEPLVATPGPYELGRQQLHAQLETAKKREAQFEQQDWEYVSLLHSLVNSHQERLDKLKDNAQAAEIVAYDRESITRIEGRIAELEAKQRAQWAQKQDAAPEAPPSKPQP